MKKVLIIDDEPVILSLLSSEIEECGFEVLVAESAEIGLDLINQHNQDLGCLILDILMPGINGYEALKAIHHRYEIPIIVISGYNEVSLRKLFRNGVSVFFSKPIDFDHLKETVCFNLIPHIDEIYQNRRQYLRMGIHPALEVKVQIENRINHPDLNNISIFGMEMSTEDKSLADQNEIDFTITSLSFTFSGHAQKCWFVTEKKLIKVGYEFTDKTRDRLIDSYEIIGSEIFSIKKDNF